MKTILKLSLCALFLFNVSCSDDIENAINQDNSASLERKSNNFNVNFQHKKTISVEGASTEIAAFDNKNNKLFVIDAETNRILVWDISDLNDPEELSPIDISPGAPNSVSVSKGKLAVAVEDENKQMPGKIKIFDTNSLTEIGSYMVGSLPDMVIFSPNGKYIVSADEGEPNADYTVDPDGTVSIIDLSKNSVTTLDFSAFNSQESSLANQGFRVFGPGANLAADVEPEYVAISDNSNYAWVTLQENNGMAKVNLQSKQIEAIYPFGYKDYDLTGNEIDPSDEDGEKRLRNVPVFGMYQPDAIDYVKIGGTDYLFTANEGDAREYEGTPGYVGEDRIKDLVLDPTVFPVSEDYQNEANLGRLKVTISQGDTDNDGDFDELYSYGARSFSVWSGNGSLLYDSGNEIGSRTLALTQDRFNDNDKRSDDKGAEPEAVEILRIAGNKYVLFVGLERNDQVLVYDISNPLSPQFISILSHPGDEAPEGLLAIPSKDSPNGKDLLIVSNEDSGTVTIYENNQ